MSAAGCVAAGTATSPNDPAYREVATVINRRFIEAGPRIRNLTTNQFQVWTGVRGSITDTIKFDVYGLHGESDRKNSNINWGLKSRVQQALRANSATECRSEEHTSELQSLMRISYAVFCLKKKNKKNH